MWTSERIAFAYFVYLFVVSWLRPLGAVRRALLALVALVAVAAIVVSATLAPRLVREWMPLASILGGYYASVLLFVAPSIATESWLMAWDRRLLGDPATRFAAWPRPVLGALEIIYMGCFLLIGAGFALLAAGGHRALADRYWSIVVGAELGSFAPLALVQTRPPWAVERKAVLADRSIHDLATAMVQRFTIRVNTFPSGHVAGSLGVALAVVGAMPWAGAILLILAAAIAVACVVGRYHYVVDVVTGALLAVALWILF